jgi:hypothetical protein
MNNTLRKLLFAFFLFGLAFVSFTLATFTFVFGTITDGTRFLAYAPGPWCVHVPREQTGKQTERADLRQCQQFSHRSGDRSAVFVPIQKTSVLAPGWISIENYDPSLWYEIRHPYVPLILFLIVMPACGLAGLLVLISLARDGKSKTPPTAHNNM